MGFNNAEILKKHQAKLVSELKRFIIIMGVEAKNHFIMSFRKQGFEDATLIKWQQRKSVEKRKGNRAILVKSGALRRSIRIIKRDLQSVTIGSDLPYAEIHNNGGTINTAAHTRDVHFKLHRDGRSRFVRKGKSNFVQSVNFSANTKHIPQRQFIGDSVVLNRKLKKLLDKSIKNVFDK